MGDAAEGLIDADARLQERIEEFEDSRKAARNGAPAIDADRARAIESLRLARIELERQLEHTTHPARRDHISQAVAEIDRRVANFTTKAGVYRASARSRANAAGDAGRRSRS
jgi:hypothetical protein